MSEVRKGCTMSPEYSSAREIVYIEILKPSLHQSIQRLEGVLRKIVEKVSGPSFMNQESTRGTNQQREPERCKGEEMKKHYLRIVLAAIGLAGLSAGARAQAGNQVAVNFSHDFVVSGKTFPAGRYIVSRISLQASTALELSSYENRVTVMVLPTAMDGRIVSTPRFRMHRVGDAYFLTQLETPDYVYRFAVPGSATTELTMKPGPAARGTSGSK
jgi:hypothetical protein